MRAASQPLQTLRRPLRKARPTRQFVLAALIHKAAAGRERWMPLPACQVSGHGSRHRLSCRQRRFPPPSIS